MSNWSQIPENTHNLDHECSRARSATQPRMTLALQKNERGPSVTAPGTVFNLDHSIPGGRRDTLQHFDSLCTNQLSIPYTDRSSLFTHRKISLLSKSKISQRRNDPGDLECFLKPSALISVTRSEQSQSLGSISSFASDYHHAGFFLHKTGSSGYFRRRWGIGKA